MVNSGGDLSVRARLALYPVGYMVALIDDYVGVSNTNMHLRAAAGKTARVLVPCPAEWRWMASGSSPWFPGFGIYRQALNGRWEDALTALRRDISAARI